MNTYIIRPFRGAVRQDFVAANNEAQARLAAHILFDTEDVDVRLATEEERSAILRAHSMPMSDEGEE